MDGLHDAGWRGDVAQVRAAYAGAAALRFLVGPLGFMMRGFDDRGGVGEAAGLLSSEGRAAIATMLGCSYEELEQRWSAAHTLLAALGLEALELSSS